MNEKIRELAMKAGFCEEYSRGIISPYMGDTDISELLEDFAELLIRQCAELAEDYDGAHYIGTAIKEHFED